MKITLLERINHAYQIGDIERARKLEIKYFSRQNKIENDSKGHSLWLLFGRTERTGSADNLLQYKTYLASIPSVWELEELL